MIIKCNHYNRIDRGCPDCPSFAAERGCVLRVAVPTSELIAELKRRAPDCRQCAWPVCDQCLGCFWKDFGGDDLFKKCEHKALDTETKKS